MSDFTHKEGSGSIFKQEKKTDKAPDYKGEIMIAGNLYELAGWIKQGKKGAFLSLSAQVKGAYKPNAPVKTEHKANEQKIEVKGFEDFDSNIPFAPHGKCGAGVSWRAL